MLGRQGHDVTHLLAHFHSVLADAAAASFARRAACGGVLDHEAVGNGGVAQRAERHLRTHASVGSGAKTVNGVGEC